MLLTIVILSSFVDLVSSSGYYNLRDYRICNLAFHETILEFIPTNEDAAVKSPPTVYSAIDQGFTDENINNQTYNGLLTTYDNTTDNIFENKVRILARHCSCNGRGMFPYPTIPTTFEEKNYYCMNGNYCGVYRYENADNGILPSVICFDYTLKVAFIRYIWPIIMLWFVALMVVFLVSFSGKNIRYFIRTFFNPSLMDRLVDERIEQEILRHRQFMEFNQTEELVLKVKRYYSNGDSMTKKEDNEADGGQEIGPNNDDTNEMKQEAKDYQNNKHMKEYDNFIAINTMKDDAEDDIDENEVACTICMIKLNDGDEIGKISCGHTFHKHCLKQWIRRTNVCPLCLTPDIACVRTSS